MKNPSLTIIGDANGSGKTTLAREYVAEKNFEYLGADDIAYELNPAHPENSAIEAARLFSRRLNESLVKGESLIVESTLSGLSLRRQIEKARGLNYEIRIVFVYLDSAELCIQRIKSRVARGGHFVPDEDVKRRYVRANTNFRNIYKAQADKWNLFFNAGDRFEQAAAGDRQGFIIIDEVGVSKMAGINENGNGSISDESLREALEIQRHGNRAVQRA